MAENPSQRTRMKIPVIIAVVMLLIPFGFSVLAALAPRNPDANQLFLERPDPQHTSCVRDTDYMRHHHWELLTQVRDEVMRKGQRGVIGVIGLNKCRECHTSRENFCNHCHDAVSLYPECFGCHYYP